MSRARQPGSAWLAVCAALAFFSLLLAPAGPLSEFAVTLAWRADHWRGAPWTLWSASVVHLTPMHLGANLLGLGAVATLGWALGAGTAACWALALAWPLANLGLVLWPMVDSCSGLSGLLHAGTAILWVHAGLGLRRTPLESAQRPVLRRPFAWVLGGGLSLKLLLENAWAAPVVWDAGWGFEVVQASHLIGALAGVACGWGCYRLSRIFFTSAVVE